jgi:hypothetical protein
MLVTHYRGTLCCINTSLEHETSHFTFIYGVADVLVTTQECNRDALAAGMKEPSPGMMYHLGNFTNIRIELDDGRWGLARYHNSEECVGLADEYTGIAFILETIWTMKPASAAD